MRHLPSRRESIIRHRSFEDRRGGLARERAKAAALNESRSCSSGPMKSLVSGYNIRDSPLELLCRRTLAHHAAEGGIASHLGVAPAPGHSPFRVEPDQPLASLRNAAKAAGARIEGTGAGV